MAVESRDLANYNLYSILHILLTLQSEDSLVLDPTMISDYYYYDWASGMVSIMDSQRQKERLGETRNAYPLPCRIAVFQKVYGVLCKYI